MTPEEIYINHLDSIIGKEGSFKRASDPSVTPPVFTLSYSDFPKAEHLMSFTIGLSSIPYHEWKRARPELLIQVKSNDLAWGFAIGHIAAQARGNYGFHVGETINFNAQISQDSEMSAFLLFYPSIGKNSQLEIQTPNYMITVIQLYPIYAEELNMIRVDGFKAFLEKASGVDFADVQRQNLSR